MNHRTRNGLLLISRQYLVMILKYVFLLLLMSNLLQCQNSTTSPPPIQLSLTPSKTAITANETIVISITSENWQKADLKWSLRYKNGGARSPGSLSALTGPTVVYTAPEEPGEVVVTVEGHQDGRESTASILFKVDSPQIDGIELHEFVNEFLVRAREAEISAYKNADSAKARGVFAGEFLMLINNAIAQLRANNMTMSPKFDPFKSKILDVRIVADNEIEVDTCEWWSRDIYHPSSRLPISSEKPQLVPQTITIKRLSEGWFITKVVFFDLPHFCNT